MTCSRCSCFQRFAGLPFFLVTALTAVMPASSAAEPNYDEAAVGPYTLPDVLAGPDGKPLFLANHAGGILGGISSGQDIVARMAFKPTSSILTPMQTIDRDGRECEIVTKGRHDPCVGIRGAPVAEAMMALFLADHALRHAAQNARPEANRQAP
jgi:chorismate synthase